MLVACLAWVALGFSNVHAQDSSPPLKLSRQGDGVVEIVIGGQPVAVYHASDEKIPRPFFTDLRTLDGRQVTRRYPPDAQRDLADHPEFHPGLWLTFGDISGSDFWRNKAKTQLREGSLQDGRAPDAWPLRATFLYRSQEDPERTICTERFRGSAAAVIEGGWLLFWDSTFTADKPCEFGDQEEMGLGFRVATEMRAEQRARDAIPPGNGRMLDAEGREGAEAIWGQAAPWCDYSGEVDGKPAGIALFCHPENFRPSWYHARDYGLLVANPFGRAAMKQGEPSRVTVGPDEPMRLRYGIWVHGELDDGADTIQQAFDQYVKIADLYDRMRSDRERSE